jgi:hypothetical protein
VGLDVNDAVDDAAAKFQEGGTLFRLPPSLQRARRNGPAFRQCVFVEMSVHALLQVAWNHPQILEHDYADVGSSVAVVERSYEWR